MELKIITIDGLAATGKSSLAKEISRRKNFNYIESGNIYRAFTYLLTILDINHTNSLKLIDFIKTDPLKVKFKDGNQQIFYLDKNLNKEISDEANSNNVSVIALNSLVREYVNKIQKNIVRSSDKTIVVEGRDTGTIVFPEAELKFYIKTDPEVKAKRRYQQLKDSNQNISVSEIYENILERDSRDLNRSIAPTIPALNAIVIDSTNLNFEETLDIMINKIEKWLTCQKN